MRLRRNRRAVAVFVAVNVRQEEWAADLAVRRESARLVAQARFNEALPPYYTGGPTL